MLINQRLTIWLTIIKVGDTMLPSLAKNEIIDLSPTSYNFDSCSWCEQILKREIRGENDLENIL